MLNKNPTIIINGLSGLLTQILPLLVILGYIHLTPERLAAFISLQGLVLAFVSTVIIKSQVSSEATVRELVDEGVRSPKGTKFETVKANVEDNKNAREIEIQ